MNTLAIKKGKMATSGICIVFLAITSAFFNILQNRFLLDYQGFQALLSLYNTTLFDIFFTFIVKL